MTNSAEFLGAVIAGALGIILCFWLAIHVAYKNGWDDRGLHEHNRRKQRRAGAANRPSVLFTSEAPEWQVFQPGRHAPFQRRLVVRTDTLAFAGGPATVPINARSDSGELRALVASSDRYIEQMHRQGSAYRRAMVTR